ncbi:MAG: tryptophan synthase subunit alpha [Clostridia bacterium]|nr:tryptophan synthase subunit alpha [Clostridia bacterium]
MTDIKKAFENGKAFIPFVTAGDPDLDTTRELILAMQEAGADLIELGVPFSDPVAEGVVIQRANERALAAGCTIDRIFDMLRSLNGDVHVPLVFLTYINPIVVYGAEKFMRQCQETGISGVIIPDLPYEEKGEISGVCHTYGISLISLIAPTSHERIRMIAKEAEGFLYIVSSMGVTGVRSEIKSDIASMVAAAKEVSQVPCAVGFGISTPQQAQEMAQKADGTIVGSAIVKLVEQHGKDSQQPVAAYVKSMKDAVCKV